MQILCIFYTNNAASTEVMTAALSTAQRAVNYVNLRRRHTALLAVSSWMKVQNFTGPNYISHYKGLGHLNIITQVLQVLQQHPADLVLFLEHDVLYAPNYIARMVEVCANTGQPAVNMDYIGMTPDGYVRQAGNQVCLSQMCMPYGYAINHFLSKVLDCAVQKWCYLEPSAQAYNFGGEAPNVHINMNRTAANHHLTNHYDTYEGSPFATEHPLWGDFKLFNFFKNAK